MLNPIVFPFPESQHIQTVRVENNELYLFSFHFSFYFLFPILDLGLRASIILYVTVRLFLLLLPPFCMVAPSSKLTNIVYISFPNLQIPQHHVTDSTIVRVQDSRL